MAESRVISMPQPKASSWRSSEAWRSPAYRGRKPASASAALGMEKGEPTLAKSASAS